MTFWTGTSGFSYAAWKGKFYPPKTKAAEMLPYYSKHFGAVEINSSFYRLPTAAVIADWSKQVPRDFRFTFKAPGAITHRRWSGATRNLLNAFFAATGVLGPKLGPSLFQFPPFLKKDLALIETLLKLAPRTSPLAFEFRHASWFGEELAALLKKHKAALVYNDADGDPMPIVSTAPTGYLRLRKTEYTESELKTYVKQCRALAWKEAFVFFKHEDGATGPALATRWTTLVGK